MIVILFVTLGFSGCKKKTMNLEKFEAICTKVAKCDKQVQQLAAMKGGNAAAVCQESLARMEKNKKGAAFVPAIMNCLQTAKCEELSMSTCLTKSMTGNITP